MREPRNPARRSRCSRSVVTKSGAALGSGCGRVGKQRGASCGGYRGGHAQAALQRVQRGEPGGSEGVGGAQWAPFPASGETFASCPSPQPRAALPARAARARAGARARARGAGAPNGGASLALFALALGHFPLSLTALRNEYGFQLTFSTTVRAPPPPLAHRLPRFFRGPRPPLTARPPPRRPAAPPPEVFQTPSYSTSSPGDRALRAAGAIHAVKELGFSLREASREFGLSSTTLHRLVHGKRAVKKRGTKRAW
jgi:hypothetical protein